MNLETAYARCEEITRTEAKNFSYGIRLLAPAERKAMSALYALARRMGRDLKNVQQDLRLLESYGLVRMARSRPGKGRRTKAPQALFSEIALKIAI